MCDDRSMAVASRVKPQDLFTPEEWTRISARSSWRGVWMVVHAWGVILAAGALFVAFPNPLTYVLAVMLIGARQLGLAILMHEAAHGGLHPISRSTTGWANGFARRRPARRWPAIAPITSAITNTPSRPRILTSCSRRPSRPPGRR